MATKAPILTKVQQLEDNGNQIYGGIASLTWEQPNDLDHLTIDHIEIELCLGKDCLDFETAIDQNTKQTVELLNDFTSYNEDMLFPAIYKFRVVNVFTNERCESNISEIYIMPVEPKHTRSWGFVGRIEDVYGRDAFIYDSSNNQRSSSDQNILITEHSGILPEDRPSFQYSYIDDGERGRAPANCCYSTLCIT